MNKELLKELIDAGFPFSEPMPPTLSELIEACGDRVTVQKREDGCSAWAEIINIMGHGSTPSEAVAKLWLSLHSQS